MSNLRVEFVFENHSGITRAYVWQNMRIIDKHPYQGTLSSEEKVAITNELRKKHTKEIEWQNQR